ncbi:MAG: aldolase/citrate lyase family protein [Victivallaceae bacterium]|nr:aldolase/citrate lyase family protein [Victivallaceae bacterium]
MRNNKVLTKLHNGETVFCFKSIYAEPDIVEMMGYLGVDVIWICNEHIAINPEKLKNVCRAGRARDVDIMVRRAFGNYDDLLHPLEMGAAGLMIPHCKSAEMAREIVRQTKFHPLGKRGVDGISGDSCFGTISLDEYMRQANAGTFIMIQIEDVEAIDEIEAIAEIDGVDIIFIGPADLSQSLGVPGNFKSGKIRSIIRRTVKACKANGKYCGTSGLDYNYMKELIAEGVRFITVGSDYGMIKKGVTEALDNCYELVNPTLKSYLQGRRKL